MNQRTRTYLSFAAVIIVCCFIYYMSAKAAPDSSQLSMGVVYRVITYVVPGYEQMDAAQQLYWQDALETPIRKLAHFSEYAILGAATLNAGLQLAKLRHGEARLTARLCMIAWALSTLYAATDEIHQLFVPGRAGMVTDVCIDSAGVAFGILVVWGVSRLVHRRSADEPRSS